ncbi:MFS transporter [Streptomyces sp. NPDC050516]|uniref:MFS transporter n=1 Tax=Streptomyces sp. NPDC050516 TaxID=3365621 RepID=UPI00378B8D66
MRTGPAPRPVADLPVTRLRWAISLFFALDGFVFAGWVVRIPAIKQQIDASAGALGLALLGLSAGTVATMLMTGRLCRRFGVTRVTIVTATVLSLSIILPPLARSPLELGLFLLVFGAGYGGLNVAFNAAAVDLAETIRRPILPSFHAAYSAGALAGAGIGGLLAPHLGPSPHMLLLSLIGLTVTLGAGRVLVTSGLPTGAGTRPGTTDPTPRAPLSPRTRRLIAVCGLITLCTAFGEGAMADWGSLHLSTDLGTGPGTAAAGYALFALLMTVSRMSGTWLLERLGESPVLIAGGLLAATGMLVAALTPELWLVFLGYALTGVGLANVFPTAVGRAGALGGPHGVVVASTLGHSGILLGPPAIGFLAEAFGLPRAMTTIAALAATAALLGELTRRARKTAHHSPA